MSGKHTLVVVPKTLLSNWQREFGKFSPEMPVRIYHGANRDLNSDDMRAVLITTYGTLLNDIDQFRTINFTKLISKGTPCSTSCSMASRAGPV